MWTECIGALHVHSRYSDGAAAVDEIVGHAREAGLDFVVVSDHDTTAALREGWGGCHDGVEVIPIAEITPHRRGHVLAFNASDCLGFSVSPSDETLDAIAAQHDASGRVGKAIVAHPQGKHRPWLRIRQKAWYHWDHPAIAGLEIWSYTHDWIDRVAWWRFPRTHRICNYPETVVTGPDANVLRLWDELGKVRPYAGVGGLDCHARRVPIANIRIFPYERMFRFMRNHFFIPADTPADQRGVAVTDALLQGRGFVAHDILADSAGTTCVARMADGSEMMMGEERPFEPGVAMRLTLPHKAEIRWIANSRCRLTATGDTLTATPHQPGVYRFEVRLGRRPWLFTNPFYLR